MTDLKQMAEGLDDFLRQKGYGGDGFDDDATAVKAWLFSLAGSLGYLAWVLAHGEDRPHKNDDDMAPYTALRKARRGTALCQELTLLFTDVIGREKAIELLTFLNMADHELSVCALDVEGPDGNWNPKDSVYFTRAQAKRHRCRCVSCRAMKGQNQ